VSVISLVRSLISPSCISEQTHNILINNNTDKEQYYGTDDVLPYYYYPKGEYCNRAQGAGRAYNDCDICMAIKNAGRVSIDARV
jgi:hypothetical protein